LDRALRRLRRITASEGILREMKRRRHYEKRARRPSASCAKPPAAGSAA
jgi:ribosomal protein S21